MAASLTGQVVEIWFLYLIGALMISARIYCRTKLVGLKHYKLDDYLILGVAAMWTAAPVIGHVFVVVAKGYHTSDLTFEERQNMLPGEYHEWEFGSKIFMLGLTGYFFIIWVLKFNMLCFYQRVVRGLWVQKFVKPAMGLVIASGVAIIFMLALTCRPFYQLWQVWPDPGRHCEPQNVIFFVVILTFNLLTDVCIMLIPAPVILGINANRWKKAGLYFVFSLGFFCMFFAVLRFTLIFHLNQRGVSALWSLREDCVGIVVGQAPLITPMLRRKFWVDIGYVSPKPGEQYPSGHPSHGHELSSGVQISAGRKTTQLSKRSADPYSLTQLGITRLGTESEEEIVRRDSSSTQAPNSSPGRTTGILVEHTVEIQSAPGRADHPAEASTKHWYDAS